MNRIFVTGDVHGDPIHRLSFKNFPVGRELDRTDLVFIAGDFGCIWDAMESKTEAYNLNFLNNKPFTTMIVGGNHENWDRLLKLPMVEKFGVQLGLIRENVFFVPNGTLIHYAGKKIFCMGGAMSTDRGGLGVGPYPGENISWWRREIPTYAEMDFGTKNLESVGFDVDLIITHTMPIKSIAEFAYSLGYHHERSSDPTANYLSFVKEHTTYRKWYCGHFHVNRMFDGVMVLNEYIVDVDDPSGKSFGRIHVRPPMGLRDYGNEKSYDGSG